MTDFAGRSFIFLSSRPGAEPGRIERRLFKTMLALRDRGAHVHFIGVPGGGLVERARVEKLTTAVYRLDKANIVRTRSRLRKYLKRYEAPLAHSFGFEADVILRLAARNQPAAVVNSLSRASWPPRWRGALRLLGETLDRRTLPMADALLVDAEDMREALLDRGVSNDRVRTDPPTVDLARVGREAEGETPRLPEGPLVGFAGRLERGRGMEVLSAAARRLERRGIQVVAAGEGPEGYLVRGPVATLGKVASVPAVLRALDVCVFPSTGPGMPTPLLEALALGKPVVASAVPGIREFFTDAEELRLVPPGDTEALVGAVEELLGEPQRTREMGERARLRVVDEFSSLAGIQRHLRLYEELLQRR